jgi:hypothetical protein
MGFLMLTLVLTWINDLYISVVLSVLNLDDCVFCFSYYKCLCRYGRYFVVNNDLSFISIYFYIGKYEKQKMPLFYSGIFCFSS